MAYQEENDRFDQPMWNRIRTIAPTSGSAIVKLEMDVNFDVKVNHMKMLQENRFDGRLLSDPYKHIADFEKICKKFRYGENMDEPVKLCLFPLSLTGEAKIWFNELEAGTIQTWTQMKEVFASQFFQPGLAMKMINDIRDFKQYERENLVDAWIRLKDMLRRCDGHGLDKERIINIFYYGLDKDSRIELDSAGGGIFFYKSANDAYKMLEDKVMMRSQRLVMEMRKDIYCFKQYEREDLVDAWIRLKDMLRRCDGHGLDKECIIDIFYYGLDKDSQIELDVAGGGIFFYKSANDAYKMLEDKVMMRSQVLVMEMIKDIYRFKQYEREDLVDAWIRLKDMLRRCDGHGLDKECIINIFYYGLDKDSRIVLDSAGGGIFFYKSANDAYKMMEDKVMMRLSRCNILTFKGASGSGSKDEQRDGEWVMKE